LAEKLGSFAGQLTESGILKVQITYEGHVAEMKIKALTSAALSGLLRPMLGDVNVVRRRWLPRSAHGGRRGDRAAQSDYESLITVTVTTERQERSVSGTVYHDGKPRLVDIKGIRVDAEFGKSMIYVNNEDSPDSSATSRACSATPGSTSRPSISAATSRAATPSHWVEVDGSVPSALLAKVQALPQVKQAKALVF